MALLPSRVKYRKSQRGNRGGNATSGNKLDFGDFGLQTLERGWIKNIHIEACRVAITRFLKRKGKVFCRTGGRGQPHGRPGGHHADGEGGRRPDAGGRHEEEANHRHPLGRHRRAGLGRGRRGLQLAALGVVGREPSGAARWPDEERRGAAVAVLHARLPPLCQQWWSAPLWRRCQGRAGPSASTPLRRARGCGAQPQA